MGRLRHLFETHRLRLARLTVILGVSTFALVFFPHVPRTVDVEFELGPSHQDIVELRVVYVQSGEELQGMALSFPKGAPSSVRHSVSLPAGDFEVHAKLRPAHGALRASIGKLRAPAEGLVRIWLEPQQR